jgi:hypothetical protein
MALTRAKQEVKMKKNDKGLEFAIDKTGILGLAQETWKSNFARLEANQKINNQ